MTWDDVRAQWEEVTDTWDKGFDDLAHYAEETYVAALESGRITKEKYTAVVKSFITGLDEAKASIERMKGLAAQLPADEREEVEQKIDALETRHEELSAGFYVHVTEAPEMGVAPVLVGTLAVSAAAIAWAYVGIEYVDYLKQQCRLEEKELDARVQASKDGRTLQDNTLPKPPEGGGVGGYIAAGLGALALAGGGYYLWMTR